MLLHSLALPIWKLLPSLLEAVHVLQTLRQNSHQFPLTLEVHLYDNLDTTHTRTNAKHRIIRVIPTIPAAMVVINKDVGAEAGAEIETAVTTTTTTTIEDEDEVVVEAGAVDVLQEVADTSAVEVFRTFGFDIDVLSV